jgi:hypothetical protein
MVSTHRTPPFGGGHPPIPPSGPRNIRSADMAFLDSLFGMRGGYVLNFSDHTFSEFFADELNVDIDHPDYARTGASKAKRLRCFLQTVDKPTVVRTLKALWEHRQALRQGRSEPDELMNAEGRLLSLVNLLEGQGPVIVAPSAMPAAIDRMTLAELKADLLHVSTLTPHARGYAFESFLKCLFDSSGLIAREPFRLTGEQIDGSFQFEGETYLVEAKWHGHPMGVAELHTFHGKIEQKAAWTRGLFISMSGFTQEGLVAFGRGKRAICMEGLDLYEMLERALPLIHVLDRKIRRAAETGAPLARVRELFP